MFVPPLGYVPPADLDAPALDLHFGIVSTLPKFAMPPTPKLAAEKVVLTELWSHPKVVAALGFAFPGCHQNSGSCVGCGGGNGIFTTITTDALRRGDPERILVPGWLRPYGRSRELIGWTTPGSGSTGAAFAKAILEGVPDGKTAGMPQPELRDGLEFSERTEIAWSSVRSHPKNVINEGLRHPVKTVSASLRSADECRDALTNLFPVLFANSYYVGRARVVDEANPVAVGEFDSFGPHQVSLQGWWLHPKLGELFLMVNQWPASVYPKDPGGGPRCSCWVTKESLDRRFRAKDRFGNPDVEAYPLSGYEGYPAANDVEELFSVYV